MAVFYKGAGFGRYYCENDARLVGLKARSPERVKSPDLLVRHIVDGTEGSPYISLTRSYSVALSYARMGRRLASEQDQAVVYEITADPGQLQLIDPVVEIARKWQEEPGYHHNGSQLTLLRLVGLDWWIRRMNIGCSTRFRTRLLEGLPGRVRTFRGS